MSNEHKAQDDRDFIQVLRDEANEWHNNSETGSLLRQAAHRLSDSLDYIDNLERGLVNERAANADLRQKLSGRPADYSVP